MRIERNLSSWKSRPSRPTRCWRNIAGPGELSLTARAMASMRGAIRASTAAATTRSKACLTANWLLFGSTASNENSGIPPTWSSSLRTLTNSNIRGTTDTCMPRSSQ